MRSALGRLRRTGTVLDIAAVCLAALALVFAAVSAAEALQAGSFGLSVTLGGLLLLLLSAGLYALGHFLRVIRLYLILGDVNLGITNLVRLHFTVSFLGAFLPFRTGDVLRFVELARATGKVTTSFVAILIERSLDVGLVLVLVALLWSSGANGAEIRPFALVTIAFLFSALFLFLVGPLALRSVARIAFARARSWRSLAVLQGCETVLRAIGGLPRPDAGRLLALFIVTITIWAWEIAVLLGVGLALGAFSADARLELPILEVLSATLALQDGSRGPAGEGYRAVVVAVLGAGAALAALPYLKRRLRSAGLESRRAVRYRIDPIATKANRRWAGRPA